MRPAKAQISLCIHAYTFASRLNNLWVLSYRLNKIGDSQPNRRLYRLIWINPGQIVTLLEISRRGSYYKNVGFKMDIMRQSTCLVLNPITVYSYGFLFDWWVRSQTWWSRPKPLNGGFTELGLEACPGLGQEWHNYKIFFSVDCVLVRILFAVPSWLYLIWSDRLFVMIH